MNSTSRHVGGHQNLDLTGLDALQGALTLSLGAVTVNGHGRDAAVFELAGQTVGTVLGTGEHDGALVLLDDVGGVAGTLLTRNLPEEVVHVARGFFTHDVVDGGVIGEFTNQRLHVGSHGGGEQHHVTTLGGVSNNATHGGQEAHVGHTVGFVDNHGGHVGEVQGALFEHVFETAGAGDDDVDTHSQGLAGDVVGSATVNAEHALAAISGQLTNFLLDLGGQFAGRHQDESLGTAWGSLANVGHQGQAEGQRLAGTRGSLADDVTASHGVRDCGFLDGEGLQNATSHQTVNEGFRDAEV